MSDLSTAGPKEVYSENVKYVYNKVLKEATILVFKGYIYLFQLDEKNSMMVTKPINILDDMSKIIYSEKKDRYLALKIRDMRKQDNKFDHLILELNDRELFADFAMEYAE